MKDPATHSAIDATSALARRRQAEAELAEEKVIALRRENDLAAGKLTDTEEIVAEAAEMFVRMRCHIEGLGDAVAKEAPQPVRVTARVIGNDLANRTLMVMARTQLTGGASVEEMILIEAQRIQEKRNAHQNGSKKNDSRHGNGTSDEAGGGDPARPSAADGDSGEH
jgi:hypothetical protein